RPAGASADRGHWRRPTATSFSSDLLEQRHHLLLQGLSQARTKKGHARFISSVPVVLFRQDIADIVIGLGNDQQLLIPPLATSPGFQLQPDLHSQVTRPSAEHGVVYSNCLQQGRRWGKEAEKRIGKQEERKGNEGAGGRGGKVYFTGLAVEGNRLVGRAPCHDFLGLLRGGPAKGRRSLIPISP